jgi:hypothetical protein
MFDSLLIAGEKLTKLVSLTVPRVHTEKYDARNRPWDDQVAEAVRLACSAPVIQEAGRYRWFALHARWFVHGIYPGPGIVPDPQVLQRQGHQVNLVVGRGAVTAALGHRSWGRP